MTIQQEDRTLGELVASATKDMTELVRSEVALAKAEVRRELKSAAKAGALLGAAGFLGHFALLFVSVAAALGIGALIGDGWGFLIVGFAYGAIAGGLALLGKRSITSMGPPKRTVKTVKDDLAWARHPTRPVD
ncbi:MAG: putative rane protein [Frankiales bacterium]|nr:putative rane protein [Frankiales bacterium]